MSRFTRSVSLVFLFIVMAMGLAVNTTATAQAVASPSKQCSSSTPIAQRPQLLPGDSGTCVTVLQGLLTNKGAFNAPRYTRNFGPATVAGVQQVQRQAGISPASGIVGPKTWRALTNESAATTTNPASPAASKTSSAVPANCLRTGKTICIVKTGGSHAKLYALQNKAVVYAMNVRTGDGSIDGGITTPGSWSIGRKYQTYTSVTYNSPMPYSMFFHGGQAIHYSHDFDVNGYGGRGASAGCVNIQTMNQAKTLFDWAPKYTSVIVSR